MTHVSVRTYHNVVSKIAEWFLKKLNGLQDVAGHLACAAPHESGLGAPAEISVGTLFLGKKYTATPVESHFTIAINANATGHTAENILAYTPPPLLLKPEPNELLVDARIPQP